MPCMLCVADIDTAAAYTAYVTYDASAKGSSDYGHYQSAQGTAASSLNAIITDLGNTKLASSADNAALTSASTIAQQVITEQQGVVPLPPPEVSTQSLTPVHAKHPPVHVGKLYVIKYTHDVPNQLSQLFMP